MMMCLSPQVPADWFLRTADAGASWNVLPNLTDGGDLGVLQSFRSGQLLVWLGDADIWISDDFGVRWHRAASDNSDASTPWGYVKEVQWSGDLFATNPGTGLYCSSDSGEHWVRIRQQPTAAGGIGSLDVDQHSRSLYVLDRDAGKIYRSGDGGESWTYSRSSSTRDSRSHSISR